MATSIFENVSITLNGREIGRGTVRLTDMKVATLDVGEVTDPELVNILSNSVDT